ncbi:MAG TPA: hypothetical protein PKI19_10700 [Elusimicrobiales bacterium]|nr:hypothetical protein [Elusimicrobiales bacterium]
MKLFSLFLFLCAAAAPALAGEFPLCMYGVAGPEDLAALKKAGFNCFQSYDKNPAKLAALAGAAAALDMQMVAAPDEVIASTYAAAAKSWPMLAWYLCDEPEVQKLKPAELLQRERRVKDWDAAQRTTFVMGNGMAAFTYGAAADALMVDWYPVNHLKLESVGYQVMLLKAAAASMDKARPGKPVWAVLQAFDWHEYPQFVSPPVGRFPTFDELRFMSYLSIARGAQGLFYYTLHQKAGSLAAQPWRWALFERLNLELNTLMPALRGVTDAPVPPGIGAGLSARVVKGGGRTFMILLNPTAAMVRVELAALKGWRPLFETHRDLAALLPGKGARWLPPYRVLVLEKRRRFIFF